MAETLVFERSLQDLGIGLELVLLVLVVRLPGRGLETQREIQPALQRVLFGFRHGRGRTVSRDVVAVLGVDLEAEAARAAGAKLDVEVLLGRDRIGQRAARADADLRGRLGFAADQPRGRLQIGRRVAARIAASEIEQLDEQRVHADEAFQRQRRDRAVLRLIEGVVERMFRRPSVHFRSAHARLCAHLELSDTDFGIDGEE